MELSNVNWNAARKSVLVLGAGAFAHAIVKTNAIIPNFFRLALLAFFPSSAI